MAKTFERQLYETTRTALLTGGRILRKGFSIKPKISYKSPLSPVTQVDRASERAIISLIRRRFPDHTFLAEESAFLKRGDLGASRPGRYRWVIDPLDGTVNYMHAIPLASVSVAVECNGQVLAGGVYDPFRNELFMAQRGLGATLNGWRIHVSRERALQKALLITGFPYDSGRNSKLYTRVMEPFLRKSMGIRRFGSAAIDLCWIACGRADGYWEFNLSPWDVAAGWLVVEEAGGRLSDFSGGVLNLDEPCQTFASNGLLHAPMLRVFRESLKRIGGKKA